MEALTWGEPDYVPWMPKKGHTPRDPRVLEALLRAGMGIAYPTSVFKTSTPNVTSETKTLGDYSLTTYRTPVGEVTQKTRINLPSEGGERSDAWVVERMIKGAEDYRVVKFMVEDEVLRLVAGAHGVESLASPDGRCPATAFRLVELAGRRQTWQP